MSLSRTLLPLTLSLVLAIPALHAAQQAQSPANPCAAKANPCAMKAGGQANPCAAKANPCAMKAGSMGMPKIDPAVAKLGTVFYVADPMNRNTATFKSQAPLEDIVGTSNAVTGYVVFDPAQPTKGGRGELSVPVASINTGIPLRDEHLRSADWLNAAANPNIVFTIDDVKGVTPVQETAGGATYTMTLVGSFSVNGQSRRLEVPARVSYLKESPQTQMRMPGDLLAGRANFKVGLKDFGVTGKQGVVGARVGETIDVEVSFVASSKAAS